MLQTVKSRKLRLLSAYLLLMLLCMTGARCIAPRQRVDPAYSSGGPSTNIAPIPGAGPTWKFGDFPWDAATFSGDLLTQINVYRNSRGIKSLRWHDGMALSAQIHAKEMNANKQLFLVNSAGIDMFERMVSANPRIDFDQAYAFVGYTQLPSGMMNSMVLDPSSRAVIEDINVTHFGASFQTAPGPYYVAVIFGQNVRP